MSNDIVIASLKEKIDELNQQAWEARVNDSPKAFQLSQESVNLARSIDYAKGLAEGLRSLGFCYVRLSKNDEAAPLLRESLSLFQSINDVKGQAVVYEYLGIIERNWGNLGASLELLLKGYALIQQVGSIEIEGTSCYQIGVTYKHLGNHENALDYLYRGLSIAKKSNNALMVAYAINIIGSIYFDNGDYNEALDCYQRGLVIRRESHDKWGEAGSLDNIGFTYLKLNDLDKAIDHCTQSLKITQSTGDKKGEANTLLHLGQIFRQAGDVGQASKFSNESLEIRKARGDKRGEAEVLLFLADLHKDRGDVEDHQIFEWLSGALKIADEIKAQDLLSKARYNLHEYYTQKGNHKESLIQLEAHLQIEKELHKNTISQKISNLEISHKAEVIIQRNKELIELNEKIEKANAELKIEASLERVRAVAMSMKKPDDLLNICNILFTELEVLGIRNLRNAMINIYDDKKKTFLNYDFSGSLGQSITVFSMIHSHPVPDYITREIRGGKSHFAEIALTGDQLADWIGFREKHGELPDPKLKNARTLCYYFYSVGAAAIGISTLSSITQQEHETLMRFRNVFDLAYKRYTDINHAEAQVKEAKIEAALERVRAKSMAMHHSDDLITVINIVQEQLLGLGFHFHAANFVTDYSEKGYTMWLASPGESFPYKIYVPQVGLKYFEAVNAAIEKGSDFATYTLNFEEKNIYFKNLFETSLAKSTSEEGKRKVFESKGMAASVVLLDKIRLNLMNLDLVPFTDEENNTLKRFGYVFEQSYTRFLDLQKAEAQAREAQIEAALERVRSRTMAMHKSDELLEVIKVISEQLLQLKFDFDSAGFVTNYTENEFEFWLAFPGSLLPLKVKIPYTNNPVFTRGLEAWEKKIDLLTDVLTYEEKNEWVAHFFKSSNLTWPSEERKNYVLNSKGMARSVALMKQIALVISNYSVTPYTDEENNILKRFANVFEQSYTRFLDLQKAEAQARESQIQLAMERVRARTMAMQRSEELAEVATILFQQVKALGVSQWVCGFGIWEIGDKEFTWYPGSPDGEILAPCKVPLTEHPVFISFDESRRRGDDLFVYEKEGEFQADHYRYMMSLPGMRELLQNMLDAGLSFPTFQIDHIANFSHGNLVFITYEHVPEMHDIFKRFAKVFEQTYTRFLDLQRAEAQAREAQIEAGLERVRSRSLAMHNTSELQEVIHTVHKELLNLNIAIHGGSFIAINRDVDTVLRCWGSGGTADTSQEVRLPLYEHPFCTNLINRIKSVPGFFTEEYTQKEKKDFFTFLFKHEPWSRLDAKQKNETLSSPGGYTRSCYVSQHTSIFIINHFGIKFSVADNDILQRFGKVFEQSYTRFLDLQKAEAQAKEAQIEVALERIRARAMAMHSSNELMDVAHILREQMGLLDQPDLETSVITLFDEDSDYIHSWHAFIEPGSSSGKTIHGTVSFRKDSSELTNEMIAHYHAGKKEYTLEATGEKLNEFIQVLINSEPEISNYIGKNPPKKVFYHFATFKGGALLTVSYQPTTEGIKSLQRRAASVFEMAYRRYRDLKKAEGQAREAQIETGLERVRSKTMAMHKSEEVTGVAVSLNEELLKLGFQGGSTIIIINKDTGDTEQWTGFSEDKSIKSCYVPYFKHPYHDALFSAWKNSEKFLVYTVKGDEKKPLDDHYFSTGYKIFPENDKKWMREMESVTFSHAFMKYGAIHWGPDHLAEEQLRILQRFSRVFEQSYTRFLDLQKAEAQAREAQIEAAVEKVRSRSLAMHKSNELQEVVHTVFERLKELDVDFYTAIIVLFKEGSKDIVWWLESKANQQYSKVEVSYTPLPYFNDLFEIRENGGDLLSKCYSFDEKNKLFHHLFGNTDFKYVPETHKQFLLGAEYATISVALARNTGIHISSYSKKLFSGQDNQIIKRFAHVFDQAYTRFLDLEKAEAQAREAKIETALERVRAKVMAMTSSKDLNETSLVFGEQLRKLGIDWQFSYFWLIEEAKNENTFWITWPDNKTSFTSYTIAEAEEYFNDCLISWRAGIKIHDNYVPPEGVQLWLDTFQRIADDAGGDAKKIMVPETFADGVYYYDAIMKYGSFGICINKPASDEEKKIQCRFAVEFERAYTRFLDLRQAEAQAREAQIETALERVRSRTMGMQRSGELPEAANLLFQQIQSLGINVFSTGYNIWENDKKSVTSWMASQGIIQPPFKLPLNEEAALIDCYQAAQQGDTFFVQQLSGEKLISHLNYMSTLPVVGEIMKKMAEAGMSLPAYMINHHAFFSHGYLLFITYEQVPEAHDIFKRFAKVFEQTYTRFLDLQKAEAQAREAQIELGLERVRARAMAMQKSEELNELIATVSTELSKLDLILDRCFIMTYDIRTLGVTWWMANPETSPAPIGLYVKYHEHAPYLAFLKAWQDRIIKWQYILEGSVKKTWDEFLFAETELSRLPGFVIDNMRAQKKVYLSASFNNFGCLTLATLEPLSDEQFDIMLRFAKVFDLTYTRFNDLKQAEAQTREAKIEAALERVRAKAMAMHKSEDLNAAVATVFEELDKLNIGILRCGIAIMDKRKPRADVWITVKSEETNTVQVSGDEPLDYHPLLRGAYDGWVKQEDFYYILEGEDLLSYYRDVASIKYQLPVSDPFDKEKMDQRQFYFNAVFQDGSLFAFMETAITDEAKMVIKRFANVFNLTYKRFLDLQKAEAQTREAKIEAALERVRARALAMQAPEELKDVAQVLRIEMGLLGVEELETCSIYINDEVTNKTECWYALKDLKEEGKKLVSDHFPLNLNDTWVGREMMNFYGSDAKQVSIVMQGNNRKEWIHYCEEKSIPFRGYYGDIIPDRTYHLYKFSHGAIGAAAVGDISAESWKLLSRAASVFSLAYSRFKDLTQARNDLIKLKEEKTRAEDALTELQATQKQLIQSEKMASLGELTAGIAHEIQNPLNFVNNFSDVSNELLEEMKVELEKGNAAEAKAIAIDVKENLEKILHHGKRADAIVKGMLQHSRSSSGQKELTDINVLAEEYLRLAYHGLRAKDKFFNARFETDLDPSISKINVVPQEIGRVILNLINNSFYAISEKKKNAGNGYEPMVTVSTKNVKPPLGGLGVVEIRVKDNGNGIPQKALDKIFQPFFTTKPTGQGTGLGLSLSYDIITKGHDGEITVETKEGEGSEFTIILPVN